MQQGIVAVMLRVSALNYILQRPVEDRHAKSFNNQSLHNNVVCLTSSHFRGILWIILVFWLKTVRTSAKTVFVKRWLDSYTLMWGWHQRKLNWKEMKRSKPFIELCSLNKLQNWTNSYCSSPLKLLTFYFRCQRRDTVSKVIMYGDNKISSVEKKY